MARLLLLFAITASVVGFSTSHVLAVELTAAQQRTARALSAMMQKAATGYAAGRYDQAGQQLQQAMGRLEEILSEASPEVYDAMKPLIARIETAHTLLEIEGISLPPFRVPPRPKVVDRETPKSDAPIRPDGKSGTPMPDPNVEQVSFQESVAPILVNRCGRCHVSDSKGGFNMSSFAALMKGPPEGVVIFAGDTVGSRLITTIETGDMPRGGGRVTPEELKTLKDWIVAGAKFDGEDPEAPIRGGDPVVTNAPSRPMLQTRRATGRETVRFSADVAPLLVEHCSGCHLDAMRTRGGLRMDTFAQLLAGGDSGPVISPGSGGQSLLVKKLKGLEGQRMPAGGRPALSDEAIKTISTWIDEGATLDVANDGQLLRVMSQLAWAARATDEEKSQRRAELAQEHLRLVDANASFASKTTDHFLVTGPVSQQTLDTVAQLAESKMKTVRSVVSAGSGEAFYEGRATIFVMPKRYDYSEFGKMVEQRQLPNHWSAHWKFDGIDAYVALIAADQDDAEMIDDRLTGPLVALAVATRSVEVPRWLAEGAGVAMAQRSSNTRDRNARRAMENALSQAVAAMKDAKAFLNDDMDPQQSDLIAGAIVATMLDRTQRRSFDTLLRQLQEGEPFDVAFTKSFRLTPEQYVSRWLGWVRGG